MSHPSMEKMLDGGGDGDEGIESIKPVVGGNTNTTIELEEKNRATNDEALSNLLGVEGSPLETVLPIQNPHKNDQPTTKPKVTRSLSVSKFPESEERVSRAARFLTHESVAPLSKETTATFLRGKGYSDEEIERAWEATATSTVMATDVPTNTKKHSETTNVPDTPTPPVPPFLPYGGGPPIPYPYSYPYAPVPPPWNAPQPQYLPAASYSNLNPLSTSGPTTRPIATPTTHYTNTNPPSNGYATVNGYSNQSSVSSYVPSVQNVEAEHFLNRTEDQGGNLGSLPRAQSQSSQPRLPPPTSTTLSQSPPIPKIDNYKQTENNNDNVIVPATVGGLLTVVGMAALRWLDGGDFVLFPKPTTEDDFDDLERDDDVPNGEVRLEEEVLPDDDTVPHANVLSEGVNGPELEPAQELLSVPTLAEEMRHLTSVVRDLGTTYRHDLSQRHSQRATDGAVAALRRHRNQQQSEHPPTQPQTPTPLLQNNTDAERTLTALQTLLSQKDDPNTDTSASPHKRTELALAHVADLRRLLLLADRTSTSEPTPTPMLAPTPPKGDHDNCQDKESSKTFGDNDKQLVSEDPTRSVINRDRPSSPLLKLQATTEALRRNNDAQLLRAHLPMLRLYATNVTSSSKEYHRIDRRTSTYRNHIGRLNGGIDVLLVMGFVEQEEETSERGKLKSDRFLVWKGRTEDAEAVARHLQDLLTELSKTTHDSNDNSNGNSHGNVHSVVPTPITFSGSAMPYP